MTNSKTTPTPRTVSGVINSDRTQAGPMSAQPALELHRRVYAHTQDCIQCGLCLPACPTYQVTGLEADSPRGRIRLIKGLADGRIAPSANVREHLDLCLDCRACEPACPSGVVYHELIEHTREQLPGPARRHRGSGLVQAVSRHLFSKPRRLQAALFPVRVLQRLGMWRRLTRSRLLDILPEPIAAMCRLLPDPLPAKRGTLADGYPAGQCDRESGRTAGYFHGCVGLVLQPEVGEQCVALLAATGRSVIVPRAQRCCGALALHTGGRNGALNLARANINAYDHHDADNPIDQIVCSAAGCGAMLRQYGELLRDDPVYAEKAARFSSRVSDISEALAPDAASIPRQPVAQQTVTYHPPCHLVHAQGVRKPPEDLLNIITGLRVVPLQEAEMCCGAAGTYNLTKPEMAGELGRRKLDNIRLSGADTCVTGNIGCALHLEALARERGQTVTFLHPATLMYRAVFGDTPV